MSGPADGMTTGGVGGEGIFAHPTGRRSDRIHEAVLRATEELLREGGLPAATVDAIAARTGVSKATVYKHWPCRTAVAAEAFGRMMADALPLPDTGNAVGDLTAQLRQVSAFYASPYGHIFAQLLAACVDDPKGAAYFREYFLAGRRRAIAQLWQRAADRGETRPGIDAETATDILFGPLVFRLLTRHQPLTDAEANKLAAAAIPALLLPTPPTPPAG
ncbi:TetR family transcriptional regulator [Micromonospora pisi]|uniref:TetR family transcriptional regulator n=2 Tax=Micromonospora pisi TaxID=589240 RepID=A0A495JJN8_9ACTN|nr:TetR family transcriptional regulator [Micromonospora pisi]